MHSIIETENILRIWCNAVIYNGVLCRLSQLTGYTSPSANPSSSTQRKGMLPHCVNFCGVVRAKSSCCHHHCQPCGISLIVTEIAFDVTCIIRLFWWLVFYPFLHLLLVTPATYTTIANARVLIVDTIIFGPVIFGLLLIICGMKHEGLIKGSYEFIKKILSANWILKADTTET